MNDLIEILFNFIGYIPNEYIWLFYIFISIFMISIFLGFKRCCE